MVFPHTRKSITEDRGKLAPQGRRQSKDMAQHARWRHDGGYENIGVDHDALH